MYIIALSRPTADFVATSLNGALAVAATSATIGTGLSIPATNSYLQVDYDSTTAVGSDNGPECFFYAAYTSGTGALTGIVRGRAGTTDVAHANGAKVQAAVSTAFLEGFVGARAYLSADQDNLVSGSDTKVLLNTETYDVGANFASNKFTAPVNGYYDVKAAILFNDCVVSKPYVAEIFVDGVVVSYAVAAQNGVSTLLSAVTSDTIYLAAGSYVELYAQSGAGANTVDIQGGSQYTYMSIHLVKEV